MVIWLNPHLPPQLSTWFMFDPKGSNYWKLTEDNIANGYPRKISEDWPGLPNNIDAAVTWPDNGIKI